VRLRAYLDRTFYPSLDDQWTARLYHDFVTRYIRTSDVLLDYGAGRGKETLHGFKSEVARSVGVDVDAAVLENEAIDQGHVIEPYGRVPYPDATFDVVVSAYVLEHLGEPDRVFAEIRRVLKPGGHFVFLTPNKRHYVPMAASLTPHAFHLWVNSRRGLADRDTFPTVYRANTPDAIRGLAQRNGFSVADLQMIEGRPEYLRPFGPLYLAGIGYERVVNAIPFLAPFRVVMLGALRREN
jgi:SAM-dependent methyltransferase